MMAHRDDADEIKRRLNERLTAVLNRFWKGYVTRGKVAYCAPTARKDDPGSFVVYLAAMGKYRRGEWYRSSAGIGGDELNLFAYGLTGSHRATAEVFREAREFVGMDDARPETPEQRQRREDQENVAARQREADEQRAQQKLQERIKTVHEIVAECVPIAGTPAEGYLLKRGLPVPTMGWSDRLKFHPRLDYELDPTTGLGPALVCLVTDVADDLTGIWQIYFNAKTLEKAFGKNSKIGRGQAAGGAVRLGGDAAHIGVGEGVETCIGAAALTKFRYPVWATLSTSGLIGFEPPFFVERITGFPDGDKPWRRHDGDLVLAEPAGRAAMRKLRERMDAIDMSFEASREPKMGQDYEDIWNARRKLEAVA